MVGRKKYYINSFQLPPFNSFERIKGKIIREYKQTSAQHANILIISHEDNHHHFISPEEYISKIEETIYKCPDLAAAVIIGYEFGGREKIVQSHGMNYFIQKTERHAWSSRAIIIINKFNTKVSLTLHTINKIVDSFI